MSLIYNGPMRNIYISPHLDDVALSCGGLVYQQTRSGVAVEIWTICAGDPPDAPFSPLARKLHARWGTGEDAVKLRREEDRLSCDRLGAVHRHFSVPDCIYRLDAGGRQHGYTTEESIFGDLSPKDLEMAGQLAGEINDLAGEDAVLYAPLGIGNHVDHQLTCAVAANLKREIRYYPDYPYVIRRPEKAAALAPGGTQAVIYSLSENDLTAWQDAVAAHASQISSFWPHLAAMRQAIAEYARLQGGVVVFEARE